MVVPCWTRVRFLLLVAVGRVLGERGSGSGCWLRVRLTLRTSLVPQLGDRGGLWAVAAVEDGERAAACSASKWCTSPCILLSMRRRDGDGGSTSTMDGGVDGRGDCG